MQAALIITAISLVIPVVVLGRLFKGNAKSKRIMREGVPGTATIVAVRESNMFVNNRPVMNLSLRVEVLDAPAYDTEASVIAPYSALGMLRPGARVGVKVDPESPADVAVDLSQLSVTPQVA